MGHLVVQPVDRPTQGARMTTIDCIRGSVYSCHVSDRRDELSRVGARLRALRQSAGETQAETAAAIGISRQYLAKAESGANITIEVVYRFATHFGVSAASVIDDLDV